MAIQTALDSISNSSGSPFGFKNRIINGAMVIDQRNAGASYTITGDQQYGSVDRFMARIYGGPGRFSMQQVTDAPADFLKSLKVTVTTTDTSGTYGYSVEQRIEGLNITDFNFGTASAATYTMSFWVKASIAGTYTCGNRTTSGTSSCVNTYTINSANTWEKKTIVFPANTGFTTGTDNGVGLICDFGFGPQTSKSTSTLGEWQSGNYLFNSGQVDLMATSGATFYITGVQLEKGSTATSFDYRPYGTELALCQRYFEKSYQQGTSIGSSGTGNTGQTLYIGTGNIVGSGDKLPNTTFMVTKRTAPTVNTWSPNGTASTLANMAGTDLATNSCTPNVANDRSFFAFNATSSVTGSLGCVQFQWSASAEL
jgi:hypothetical protein